MLIDMKKVYQDFQNFTEEDWEQVDKDMTRIITERETEESQQ